MIKPRREHQAIDAEIDRLSVGQLIALTVRTDDEADHTFLLDAETFERLAAAVAELRRDQTHPRPQR